MDGRARRGLLAAIVCTGFVLALPGVFGHLTALVDSVLFDAAAAGGNSTTTFTNSTSTSTSVTEQTVEADQHETRITAVRDDTIVFDQAVDAPPESPAVAALVAQAAAALAGPGCASTPLTVVGSSRTPTGSTTADTPEVEVTETVEHAIGPDTIQIGDRDTGGTTFIVQAGTENFNFNTNTHTEILRTTTNAFLNAQHSQASGACAGASPLPDVSPVVAETPPVAAPVVATPRTAG